MVMAADDLVSDNQLASIEATRVLPPQQASCAGMFYRELPDRFLNEAIGLASPGNGTTCHPDRTQEATEAGTRTSVCRAYYNNEDDSVLPRSIATKEASRTLASLT